MDKLEISDLHCKVGSKSILKGLNLIIKSGEIHAIMGPNGSGKSTLCYALMGHPKYKITKGKALFNGKNIFNLDTTERARLGLFLGFQNPIEVPGVNFANLMRIAKNESGKVQQKNYKAPDLMAFMKDLKSTAAKLKIDESFIKRPLNEGFSGGEKKRAEIAQMAFLEPKIAFLDEIDSGLDIDALKTVALNIKKYFEKNKSAILLITHYQRILNYISPHFVHIMFDGKIIKSGTKKLAEDLEKHGYEKYIKS